MFIFSECETSEGTEQWFHWPLSTDEEILWACCSRNLPMLTTSIHLGGGDINTKTFFWRIMLQIQVAVTREKQELFCLTEKD